MNSYLALEAALRRLKRRGRIASPDAQVAEVQTETGSMRVSSPEATAFDLVRFAPAAGHLGNVATVLGELAEKLDRAALAKLAHAYPAPDAQRLAYPSATSA